MREKSRWLPILAVGVPSVLILIAVVRMVGEEPPAISEARKTASPRQSDDDSYEADTNPRFTSNYVRRPRPKRLPLAKLQEAKLSPLPEKINDPKRPIKHNGKNQAQGWRPVGHLPGYSVRHLDDGTTEVRSPDGKTYLVGMDECFTIVNGEPQVLKSGVTYVGEVYKLRKNGVEIDIDPETAHLLQDEYKRLGEAVKNSPDEETRAWYHAQIKALYEQYGVLKGSASTITATREPASEHDKH